MFSLTAEVNITLYASIDSGFTTLKEVVNTVSEGERKITVSGNCKEEIFIFNDILKNKLILTDSLSDLVLSDEDLVDSDYKAICVFSGERSEKLPNVPTATEEGFGLSFPLKNTPIIMFGRPECGDCHRAERLLDEIYSSAPYYREIPIIRINNREYVSLVKLYDHYYIPSFYINGVKKYEHSAGQVQKETLLSILDEAMDKSW